MRDPTRISVADSLAHRRTARRDQHGALSDQGCTKWLKLAANGLLHASWRGQDGAILRIGLAEPTRSYGSFSVTAADAAASRTQSTNDYRRGNQLQTSTMLRTLKGSCDVDTHKLDTLGRCASEN